MNSNVCVGLFGTCGGSSWRDKFMSSFEEKGINYFNPQVDNWKPEDAVIEAEHLANDQIVLFPITGETFGMGSLSETGFSILQAVKLEEKRDFVLLIDSKPNDSLLEENPSLYKESCRARALVIQHLKKLQVANVYLVDTLEEMLEVTLVLHKQAIERESLKRFSLSK